MMPENDANGTVATRQVIGRWYKPIRCSICTSFIWFRPIVLKESVAEEPVETPKPPSEWILCKPCHKALLVEMRRSTIRSPARLRIAIGLVASERSPAVSEYVRSQREFALVIWLLALFTLLHLVIFAIILVVPK